jgi:biopolymer transport protein ExbD
MKYESNTSNISAETDMTPMIDVTFQLIAFFMFVLNFGQGEKDARVNLPASELAKPPVVPFEVPIVLQLTKEGHVLYGGEELTISALRPRLLRERQVLERRGAKVPDATVIIRADGAAKMGVVQELIKECQAERFEKFALRAMSQEEKRPP